MSDDPTLEDYAAQLATALPVPSTDAVDLLLNVLVPKAAAATPKPEVA